MKIYLSVGGQTLDFFLENFLRLFPIVYFVWKILLLLVYDNIHIYIKYRRIVFKVMLLFSLHNNVNSTAVDSCYITSSPVSFPFHDKATVGSTATMLNVKQTRRINISSENFFYSN